MSNDYDLDWDVKTGDVTRQIDINDSISKEKVYKYFDIYDAGIISRKTLEDKLGLHRPEGNEFKDNIALNKTDKYEKDEVYTANDMLTTKKIVTKALESEDGRNALAQAMIAPKRLNTMPKYVTMSDDEITIPFWKITGQEGDKDGFIVTYVLWPKNRLIVMKDTKHNKEVVVPVWYERKTTNSQAELIEKLKKSVDS